MTRASITTSKPSFWTLWRTSERAWCAAEGGLYTAWHGLWGAIGVKEPREEGEHRGLAGSFLEPWVAGVGIEEIVRRAAKLQM